MRPLVALVTLLAFAGAGWATPAHKQGLAQHLGSYLPTKLNQCALCHLPETDGERPHNAFGARLAEVGRHLRKANQPAAIAARFDAIARADSDGDGVDNLREILTGHAPGLADDVPSPAEVASAKLAEYQASRSTYAWQPFAPVQRPPVPAGAAHPVDAFLNKARQSLGIPANAPADPRTLIRRVTLDLTGLPPTPAEVSAFLADTAPDAYERLVDRLLASPQYGERWG
jgi:hypothetical protein